MTSKCRVYLLDLHRELEDEKTQNTAKLYLILPESIGYKGSRREEFGRV